VAPYSLAMLVVGLLNVWISYALATKRLHDRGRTGWWLAVQLLVLFAALVRWLPLSWCRKS
jgi:uncharacterized membrane protein YhaH (DUF805 family)